MGLEEYRTVFVAVGLIGVLISVYPALSLVFPAPPGEVFSELWILGSEHKAENYPFDVEPDAEYSIYLGVRNRLGSLARYAVYVKLRNQTEALPNSTSAAPSALEPLFEYSFFVSDDDVWEKQIDFSLKDVSVEGEICRVSGLALDGHVLGTDKTLWWDYADGGFFCQLFFELWLFNMESSAFQFHSRFVGLWLNVTVAG